MALRDDTLDMPSNRPRIMIRVTEEELSELEEAAREEYRTVPSFVLVLVRKFLDERRRVKQQTNKTKHKED